MSPACVDGSALASRRALAGVGVAALLALAACGGEPRHSALLITLDTTRADALSCYGNAAPTTPALDALAADGVLFEDAHTVTPVTLPAHASILTGLYPVRHRLRDNGVAALPAAAVTVAERARAAGVRTAAFVSAFVLNRDLGLAQGFETYSTPEDGHGVDAGHGLERSAADTIDAALAWLAAPRDGAPFFLWVHLFDPHHPYEPPADLAGRFPSPYLAEVAGMDREIARLLAGLERLGLAETTFVLALGDHGEDLGDHGEMTHGAYCYESTMHVPMIARWPAGGAARRSGERSHEIVSGVDAAPTLVEALGLAPLEGVDGRSFYAARMPAERGIYLETYYGYLAYGWSPIAGWLDARGKYLHSSGPEFYDWRADPAESDDLVAARAAELEPYRAAIGRAAREPALEFTPARVEQEAIDALQALGYAGADSGAEALPPPLEPGDLPVPRAQASFFADEIRAHALSDAKRPDEAAAIYAAILERTPDNLKALDALASCRFDLGQHDQAAAIFQRLARMRPLRPRYPYELGLALLAAGRPEDALAPLERAAELSDGRKQYLDALAVALRRLGRGREVAELAQRYGKRATD